MAKWCERLGLRAQCWFWVSTGSIHEELAKHDFFYKYVYDLKQCDGVKRGNSFWMLSVIPLSVLLWVVAKLLTETDWKEGVKCSGNGQETLSFQSVSVNNFDVGSNIAC